MREIKRKGEKLKENLWEKECASLNQTFKYWTIEA